jgi:heptosyltransferase-3
MNLLIKIPESISEMVLFSPVLKVIKEKVPEVHITVLADKAGRDIFSHDSSIDEVWTIDSGFFGWKYFRLLNRKWKSRKFTHFVYFGGSKMSILVAWLKRIKIRAGYKSGLWGWMLNDGLKQEREFIEMHQTEYDLNLLKPLGINYQASERKFLETKIDVDSISSKKSLDTFVKDILKEGIEYNNELIFLHPGAPGLHPHWSSRNFGRLISRIEQANPNKYTYVISYTKKDADFLVGLNYQLAKKKNKNLKGKVYYFNGLSRGLRFYIEVLKHAKLFVGHSTGAYYIANSIGVKSIGLYLPLKSVSAFRWAPFKLDDSSVKVVVPEVVCGEVDKCIGQKCPYYECMGRIEVAQITKKALEFLGNKKEK